MKTIKRNLGVRLFSIGLAATLMAVTLPFAGLRASAIKMKGAFLLDGTPTFAYVVTGIRAEGGKNTVKLYQDTGMQSYEDYTGVYTIPEQVYDGEDMRFYTVTEIGGAVSDTVAGALQGVPLRGVTLPRTVSTIGSLAFANCSNLTDFTFPTSVTSLASDAFSGVTLRYLTLNVCTSTTLSNKTSYVSGNQAPVFLPSELTSLEVSAPLTIAGSVSVPGSTSLSNTSVTVREGAFLTLEGPLFGTGVIEVKNFAGLTVETTSPAYNGSIRLTGANARFTNHSHSPVVVLNTRGKAISVQPGDSLLGSDSGTSTIIEEPNTPQEAKPQISVNYGGVVAVEDSGKVVVISAYDGYHVADVVINGLSMGSITRYEFAAASQQNTVAVTFAEGQNPSEVIIPELPIFTDVPASASYADDVIFLTNNGILRGVSKTRFAPDQETSRAMFISLLQRLEIYGGDFKLTSTKKVSNPMDVPEEMWYTHSMSWAVQNNIIAPDANWNVYPNRLITREEAALCLYSYTHLRGYDTITDAGRYRAYRDSILLEGESRQAMVWAATSGYLRARGGLLNPAGTVTRAEVAEMFALYLKAN